MKEVSITSLPKPEQDVIVLFNQLVAGGVIRGLKLMPTSSHEQYDGIYKYVVKEPFRITFSIRILTLLACRICSTQLSLPLNHMCSNTSTMLML